MSHKLRKIHFLFLHNGGQCPWHVWMIDQVREAANTLNGTVRIVDITQDPEIAAKYQVFFPLMTIINDKLRIPAPISTNKLVKIVTEGVTESQTISKPFRPPGTAKKVSPLTVENIIDTCRLCNYDTVQAHRAKQEWAARTKGAIQDEFLGFASYEGKKLLGAVEFLPASLVPYPLPDKSPTIAFITCIYSTEDSKLDYRGQVLEHLIEYLKTQGYKKVQVIAGRRTAYPNGPVSLFFGNGFKEVVKIDSIILKTGKEELVLMEKGLQG
ncbi:MAG: hypothetical protein ACFFC7_28590 [Candidatus Hermodarchaeota archaeon]